MLPLPCITMLKALGFSPLVAKTRLSDERYVPPEAERIAPPVPDELSHPRPGPPGGFPQGHAITPLVPGMQRLAKSGPPARSRTKTSCAAFVSPGTRLAAAL